MRTYLFSVLELASEQQLIPIGIKNADVEKDFKRFEAYINANF